MATSTFVTCGLLLQTRAQYSAAENTRDCVQIRSVLADAPRVVPARRRMREPLRVILPATSSRCCLKFNIRSRRTSRYLRNGALVIDKHVQFPFSLSVIELVGGRSCIAYTIICRLQFRRYSTRTVMYLLRPSSISFQDGRRSRMIRSSA